MINFKFLIFAFALLFLIPISSAFTGYNNTGGEFQQYVGGIGDFNENLVTSIISSQAFTSLTNLPLVADLDGDGVNEIIVIDGNDVLIRNLNLGAVDGFTLEGGTYSNPIIIDLDEDNFAEIIIGHELTGNISILEFNGTDFQRQAFLNYELPSLTGKNEIMLNCGDEQGSDESISCLIVSSTTPDGVGTRNFSYAGFNASDVGATTTIVSTPDTNQDYCLPAIQSIAYSNFDTSDSRKEFIFTVTEFNRISNEILNIMYIDVAENLATTEDQQITFSTNFNPHTATLTVACGSTENIGKFYTSPLVEDIDGIGSNGKETIVGLNEDNDEFIMKVFRANGNDINTHPAVFQADGQILSNPILSNVFGDTGKVEYCVLGHTTDSSQCQTSSQCLDLLCGSSTTGNIFETVEFKFDTSGRFNVSETFDDLHILSHGVQDSNQPVNIANEGNTDTTEFLTTYGVFRLSDSTFNGSTFVKDLDIIFDGLIDDSTCIQVDAQKTNPTKEDIICLTSTQLFFIDDGFQNSPADIDEEGTEFNPCVIDSVIKLNETLQVLITVDDADNDLVSSIVTVYKDDDNNQVSTVSNVTAGAVQPHSFILNKTISGGVIELQGFDVENPSTIDVITQTFTVGVNGIEFGQSSCTLAPEEPVIVGVLNISAAATANEGLTDFFEESSSVFRISPLIVILFLMLGWTIAVLTTADKMNSSMITMNKVVFMLVGNAFIFIIGAVSGAISFGALLVFIILGIVAIGIWARRMFTANAV